MYLYTFLDVTKRSSCFVSLPSASRTNQNTQVSVSVSEYVSKRTVAIFRENMRMHTTKKLIALFVIDLGPSTRVKRNILAKICTEKRFFLFALVSTSRRFLHLLHIYNQVSRKCAYTDWAKSFFPLTFFFFFFFFLIKH